MSHVLAGLLAILWTLMGYDLYTHCLTADPWMQGWAGVGVHAVTYVVTWFSAWYFRDLQRS